MEMNIGTEKQYRHTWDAPEWLKEISFTREHRSCRKKVYLNTIAIVKDGGYVTASGKSVSLYPEGKSRAVSKFYSAPFTAPKGSLAKAPEITVVPDDCLDVAEKWAGEGLDVSVLNMANRRNPGGGVRGGAGAQEEYLFRCSDYYRTLYQYADYADMYGVKKACESYPMDRNFGGIYSENVTVFRENEKKGYALIDKPWTVNMIAVAGINRPPTESINGQTRLTPAMIEATKNKLRTVFRIAADNSQTNIVLGALGCGAFKNPPEHVAQLFREVLCEQEFRGCFERICFAVKTDHNSNGGKNFDAFYSVLNGFVPEMA